MTTAQALRVLRERWWVVLLAAGLAAMAAYAYVKAPWVEPRYRSSVFIQATGRLDYGNFLALEKELRPLAERVRQLGVMREVDRNLHTDLAPERLLDRTRAEPVQDSGQIRLEVEDSDPQRAEQLSLEIADVYARQHNAAEQGKLREERVILSTLDRSNTAILIWPQTSLIIMAAAVLGVLVGTLLVLGLGALDTTIRTEDDLRVLELPILGVVPKAHKTPRGTPTASPAPTGHEVHGPADLPTTAARL